MPVYFPQQPSTLCRAEFHAIFNMIDDGKILSIIDRVCIYTYPGQGRHIRARHRRCKGEQGEGENLIGCPRRL